MGNPALLLFVWYWRLLNMTLVKRIWCFAHHYICLFVYTYCHSSVNTTLHCSGAAESAWQKGSRCLTWPWQSGLCSRVGHVLKFHNNIIDFFFLSARPGLDQHQPRGPDLWWMLLCPPQLRPPYLHSQALKAQRMASSTTAGKATQHLNELP